MKAFNDRVGAPNGAYDGASTRVSGPGGTPARMSACATEELLEQFHAFHGEDVLDHLDAMVEQVGIGDLEFAAHAAERRSRAPNTRRATRAATSAPAHIAHGSSVE